MLCILFLFTSFLPGNLEAVSQPSSFIHLSSQYKFSPQLKGKSSASTSTNSGIVVLSRSASLKRRPKNYGQINLSPRAIHKKISAKSAVVMDAVSKQIIYSQLADRTAQPASTIKVLTGLISIDSLNGRDLVPVSRRASRMPRSKVYLRWGRKYPADDLINAVLLASANDASVALAEKIAGSERVFAKLMTAKARSLGAKNTVCKTANGLTARGQKTTARDLALIFAGAMQEKSFAEKLSKRKIKCGGGMVVYSHNKALWRINGTVGGKTGYTNSARQTYVGKFKRNDDELIVALLGSETMWSDVKRLVEYGFAKKAKMKSVALRVQAAKNTMSLVKLDNSLASPTLPVINSLSAGYLAKF